ncbi:MAG TPA: hypothetical protein VGN57_12475 [Pirellulaceae bacterium]|nr:hypothetical protein [Pirellulaceae bacterium]
MIAPSRSLLDRTRCSARLCCCVIVLSLVATTFARGAAVFLVGEDEPVYGYLISSDASTVVLDVPQADGRRSRTTFLRDRVEDLVVTVDPERLAGLSPDDPLGYLQYAEELSIKKQDPEARDAARRLFLIAGSLVPQVHGRQAALGLANVAAGAEEARKARTLASLADPSGPAAEPVVARPPAARIDAGRARVLVAGIQAYRRGEVATARRAFDDAENARLLASLDPPVPMDLLKPSLAEREFRPDHRVLAALVPLERSLRVEGSLAGSRKSAGDDPFSAENRLPVAWPTWKNVTDFDPAETVFRDGKWRRP